MSPNRACFTMFFSPDVSTKNSRDDRWSTSASLGGTKIVSVFTGLAEIRLANVPLVVWSCGLKQDASVLGSCFSIPLNLIDARAYFRDITKRRSLPKKSLQKWLTSALAGGH